MKNIYILFLVLVLPCMVIGQSLEETYIQKNTYLDEYATIYPNGNYGITPSNIFNRYNGDLPFTQMTLFDDVLTVQLNITGNGTSFNYSFSQSYSITPALPNMVLGPIYVNGTTYTHRILVLENNTLKFIEDTADPGYICEAQPPFPAEFCPGQKIIDFYVEVDLDNAKKLETITYFDGLSAPKQQIAVEAGGQKEDIVTHIEFDEFGRQIKEFLPFSATTQNGAIFSDPLVGINNQYNIAAYDYTTNAYSEMVFESSPLNRVKAQAAPENDWAYGNGHEIKFDYLTNTAADAVRIYSVDLSAGTDHPTLVDGGSTPYAAAKLYKNITKDENWTGGDYNTVQEFTDFEGRVVLKRSFADSDGTTVSDRKHDTYYVYDKYNNLTFVIPPLVKTSDGVSPTELSELCYQYKYDVKNRLIEKQIPGKGLEYIVYNKLDQPVMTQDANLKNNHQWLFTKYDVFGRVVYTGYISDTNDRTYWQNQFNTTTILFEEQTTSTAATIGEVIYYTNQCLPTNLVMDNIYTLNYYDNYNFYQGSLPATNSYGKPIVTGLLTKGLSTGSKVRVLETNNKWILTTTGYDEKGRGIWSKISNEYLETNDIVHVHMDFVKVLESTTEHTKTRQAAITIVDAFTYDHMGRMLTQTQTINNTAAELIVSNTYDELGQLTSKKVGGQAATVAMNSVGLQNVDFTYNIRGWLKQINNPETLGDDLFGFKINYNSTELGSGFAEDLYNGNIAETLWSSKTEVPGETSEAVRGYAYSYDALNRILKGEYYYTPNSFYNNNYSLNYVRYDKNGNIQQLNRDGYLEDTDFADMDLLKYTYNNNGYGNKLLKVVEIGDNYYGFKDGNTVGDDYAYDVNGNMTVDKNKHIANIQYNYLNLPVLVTFESLDGIGNDDIKYVYSAAGVKLEKRVGDHIEGTNSSSTDLTQYDGGFIYKQSIPAGHVIIANYPLRLEMIQQPEGYIEPYFLERKYGPSFSGRQYFYQYKDHLGNNRLTYTNNTQSGLFIEDTFDTGTSDWVPSLSSVTLSNDSGRMQVDVASNGSTSKYFTIDPNLPVYISFDYDPGTMLGQEGGVNGYIGLIEFIDNNWEGWPNWNGLWLPSEPGHLEIVASASSLSSGTVKLFLQRNTSNVSTPTTCYIDNLVITQYQTEIVEENNYYPFGLRHNGYNNLQTGTQGGKFKYNGKELNDELGLEWYDFGARNYDAALGRWMNMDPKAELLERSSPYVYAFNSPIVYLDMDGELPILINGNTDDSGRASANYWGVKILNTIRNSGIANPHSDNSNEFHFVDGNQGLYRERNRNGYTGKEELSGSGAAAFSSSDRIAGGRVQAEMDWQTILNKLEKDPETGKIIEKIQIYTHSRGGAFGVGYTEKLLELIKTNSDLFSDPNNVIDLIFNMAPHQSNSLNAPEGTNSFSIDHDKDWLSGNDMGGLNAAFSSDEGGRGINPEAHGLSTFANDLNAFLFSFVNGGTTQSIISGFVQKMKDDYGIEVTVEN